MQATATGQYPHHPHHGHQRRWASNSFQEPPPMYMTSSPAMMSSGTPSTAPSPTQSGTLQSSCTNMNSSTNNNNMMMTPPNSSPASSTTGRLGLPSTGPPVSNSTALVYAGPYSGHHGYNQYGHGGHGHGPYAVAHPPRSSNVNRYGRPDISEDEREEIRMAFDLFDTKKIGKLTYRELKVAMRALDFDVKKVDVKKLMQEHTKDGNTDEVDMDEFMEILSLKYKERDPNEELTKAFKFFDEDGSGVITIKNLRKVARDLGEHITDEELNAMIEEFDNDQDGGINEGEFYNIMKRDDFDD